MGSQATELAVALMTQFLGSMASAAAGGAIANIVPSRTKVSLDKKTRDCLERGFQAWLEAEKEPLHIEMGDIYIIVEQGVGAIESGEIPFRQLVLDGGNPVDNEPSAMTVEAIRDMRRRRIAEAEESRGGFQA